MEDGSDGLPAEPLKNGEVAAKLPEIEDEIKINGNTSLNDAKSEESDDSSDYDALVIDESVNIKKKEKRKRGGFRGFKNTEEVDFMHSNPYFKESIFELLEKSQDKKKEVKDEKVKNNKNEKKGKGNPKLREYTQYLGLQPTVQFKCKKCMRSGFPSWGSLNDHILQCNQTAPVNNSVNSTNVSGQTNIRVTRNVFLCSACGTYYENWNLFLHMREVHRRYICLYCLGMFSHPEKLSMHIISKHNCVPNRINTLEEFYNIYKVPCFLMCCECQKVFTETDNFFEHQCLEINSGKLTAKSTVKNTKNSKPVGHITGDSSVQTPVVENEETMCNEEVKNDNCETPTDSINQNSVDFDENEPKSEQEFKTVETVQEPPDTNLTDNNFDESTMPQENDSQNNSIENTTQDSQDSNLVSSPKEDFVEDEMETRKIPSLTLKLPKSFEYKEIEAYESDDSEKLTMEVDQIENESQESNTNLENNSENQQEVQIQIAGSDIPIIELELEQPLDKFDIKLLLQKCLGLTVPTCVYCNHARKISVNGKQLGLHAIAEHRFSAVVNSITAEELIPESFVARIRDSLGELENVYFNLESNSNEAITFSHVFECFQCRYSTTIHKELYLHNRKMHAKSILLCIMCKSNFYSYSELICHLCPGLYELDSNIRFRCCMCVGDELPSAFRLMVHLRKRHHACDVCLELCHNQSKLSNHVWKHKLHHLCYRCGIAYRNKPDITKHLFWKHGTESVLCKKCLQKKWPHVYHFCIPPLSFICEECNLSFSRAVYLMVHKRLHVDDKPHVCTEENCEEKFVSKKLLLKHEFKHREPQEEPEKIEDEKVQNPETQMETESVENISPLEADTEEKEKPKVKVDVYDLPELNLSESDSSDSETENKNKVVTTSTDNTESNDLDGKQEEKPVLETIWDDFRNYQAIKDKEEESKVEEIKDKIDLEIILNDHDYCVIPPRPDVEVEADMSADHDYCTGPKIDNGQTATSKSPKKKRDGSSSSSSDSDSSSCTCGSNCSCSSSSGSSSSSSDSSESDSSSSEGRRRQEARRERRKQKANKKMESESAPVDVVNDAQPIPIPDIPIQESDLETTESDTDEDFYDKQPQTLANKLLEEKKNQLLQMATIGPYINGSLMDTSRPPTPSLPEEPKKKKSKSKKKKKKNKSSKYDLENPNNTIQNNYQSVAPLMLTLPKNSPTIIPSYNSPDPILNLPTPSQSHSDADTNLRASKRRRVPNKFYGYSSDEEQEKTQPPVHKWRKMDLPSPRSPLVVPPITIKTVPAPEPSRIPNDFRHHIKPFRPPPPIVPKIKPLQIPEQESGTDSNDSSSDEEPPSAPPPLSQPQPALYCYCRCPYDEVSEMIGCDSSDCAIEWFHFECVGIMVPPKGQWFCPDCRKKKQQRRELLQGHAM